MFDPFTIAMIGGAAGGLLNKKDPLKGALMGAGLGYAGGSMAPGLLGSAPGLTAAPAATSGTGTSGNNVSSKGYYTRIDYSWSYSSVTDSVTISGTYTLGAGSTFFSNYSLSGALIVNGQTLWTPSGNYSINANSELQLATFNVTIPRSQINYSSIVVSGTVQMNQQGLAWSLPTTASSVAPQVINGTWVDLT